MNTLLNRLEQGDILISDGATGTYLQGKGLEPDYEVTARDVNKADVMQVEKAEELLSDMISTGQPQK